LEDSRLCVNQGHKLLSNHSNRVKPMGNQFIRVTETSAFEELTESSKDHPIVIFKHSLTCPISSAAYERMEEFDGEVALVEVQRARPLSAEIESRLGVAHESPQVIVLSNGQVVWNASHFSITAEAVAAAVREAVEKSKR